MLKRFPLLILFSLPPSSGACYGEPLKVHTDGRLTQEQREAIDGAQEYIGRKIEIQARPYGAVHIDWMDDCEEEGDRVYCGRASTQQYGCKRKLRAIPLPWVLAHEIAHSFRIKHSKNPNDLMWTTAKENAPQFSGFGALQRRMDDFAACTPG